MFISPENFVSKVKFSISFVFILCALLKHLPTAFFVDILVWKSWLEITVHYQVSKRNDDQHAHIFILQIV